MQPDALPDGLPEPNPDSLAHSLLVARTIAEAIRAAGGAIPFGEFMQHALYAPGLGYYVAGARKFGEGGDFVTAPEVSPLFGSVIARQIAPVLAAIGDADVLEIGAGRGALAVPLLERLAELRTLPRSYQILDVSPDLVARQRERLTEALPDLVGRVRWLDGLPADFSGVVIANEVADALPVEQFRIGESGVEQGYVSLDGEEFRAGWAPASPAVARAAEKLSLPVGYESTLSLGLGEWVSEVVAGLSRGCFLIADYGLSRREYYAADRSGGWLRCHFRHRVHDNPLVLPGIQDLSAWVDFSAVAEAGRSAGAEVAGYLPQAQFLLHGGLDDEFAAASPPSERERLELAGQVKRLTMPTEMGETFKCLALMRGELPRPAAFDRADQSASL